MLHSGVRVGALFGTQHHHRASLEPAHSADHCGVVGKGPIPRQRCELGDQRFYISKRPWPVRMASDLCLLPGRQLGIRRTELAVRLIGQARDLFRDIDAIRLRHAPELFNLALELGNRLFEVQEVTHAAPALAHWARLGRARPRVWLRSGLPSGVQSCLDPGPSPIPGD